MRDANQNVFSILIARPTEHALETNVKIPVLELVAKIPIAKL